MVEFVGVSVPARPGLVNTREGWESPNRPAPGGEYLVRGHLSVRVACDAVMRIAAMYAASAAARTASLDSDSGVLLSFLVMPRDYLLRPELSRPQCYALTSAARKSLGILRSSLRSLRRFSMA